MSFGTSLRLFLTNGLEHQAKLKPPRLKPLLEMLLDKPLNNRLTMLSKTCSESTLMEVARLTSSNSETFCSKDIADKWVFKKCTNKERYPMVPKEKLLMMNFWHLSTMLINFWELQLMLILLILFSRRQIKTKMDLSHMLNISNSLKNMFVKLKVNLQLIKNLHRKLKSLKLWKLSQLILVDNGIVGLDFIFGANSESFMIHMFWAKNYLFLMKS